MPKQTWKTLAPQLRLVCLLSLPASLTQITTIAMQYIDSAMIGAQGYYEYLAGARADLSLNAYATRDIDDAVVAYRAQVRDIFA